MYSTGIQNLVLDYMNTLCVCVLVYILPLCRTFILYGPQECAKKFSIVLNPSLASGGKCQYSVCTAVGSLMSRRQYGGGVLINED